VTLQETLAAQISQKQKDLNTLKKEHGNKVYVISTWNFIFGTPHMLIAAAFVCCFAYISNAFRVALAFSLFQYRRSDH